MDNKRIQIEFKMHLVALVITAFFFLAIAFSSSGQQFVPPKQYQITSLYCNHTEEAYGGRIAAKGIVSVTQDNIFIKVYNEKDSADNVEANFYIAGEPLKDGNDIVYSVGGEIGGVASCGYVGIRRYKFVWIRIDHDIWLYLDSGYDTNLPGNIYRKSD